MVRRELLDFVNQSGGAPGGAWGGATASDQRFFHDRNRAVADFAEFPRYYRNPASAGFPLFLEIAR